MGTQPGGALQPFALETDEAAEHGGDGQSQHQLGFGQRRCANHALSSPAAAAKSCRRSVCWAILRSC
jgi:hypothetical protein